MVYLWLYHNEKQLFNVTGYNEPNRRQEHDNRADDRDGYVRDACQPAADTQTPHEETRYHCWEGF